MHAHGTLSWRVSVCGGSNNSARHHHHSYLYHPPYQARRLKRRLVYQCHTSNFQSSLPAFLVGAGSDHYIAFGGWYGGDVSGHWSPLLDNALGTPVSDAE